MSASSPTSERRQRDADRGTGAVMAWPESADAQPAQDRFVVPQVPPPDELSRWTPADLVVAVLGAETLTQRTGRAEYRHTMGCLIALLAMIGPRVTLVFVWISTGFVDRAYDSTVVPVLGLIFLPWTTLIYALVYDGHNVNPIGWFCVALALLADVTSHAASARKGYDTQRA